MQGTGLGNPRRVLVIETSKITVFYELLSFLCQPSKTKILRSQTFHTSYYVVKSHQCDMLFSYVRTSTNCIGHIFAKLSFQCILLLQKSNYSPKVHAISKVVIEQLRINSFGSTGTCIFLACIAGARNKWVQERMGEHYSACYAGQYFPFCFLSSSKGSCLQQPAPCDSPTGGLFFWFESPFLNCGLHGVDLQSFS